MENLSIQPRDHKSFRMSTSGIEPKTTLVGGYCLNHYVILTAFFIVLKTTSNFRLSLTNV